MNKLTGILNQFKDIFVGVLLLLFLVPALALSVGIIAKLTIIAFKFGYGLW